MYLTDVQCLGVVDTLLAHAKRIVAAAIPSAQQNTPTTKLAREDFAHLICTILAIVRANSDRAEKMFEKVCAILTLAFSHEPINESQTLFVQLDTATRELIL